MLPISEAAVPLGVGVETVSSALNGARWIASHYAPTASTKIVAQRRSITTSKRNRRAQHFLSA